MLLRSAVLSVFGCTVVIGSPRETPEGQLALVGGTVYVDPTAEPIRDGVVLMDQGSIVAVGERISLELPAKVETLDCSGLAVTAGYWNSHVHFFERKWADAASIPAPELERQLEEMCTRYGFTSVFDLSSRWENTRRLRERIGSGEVPGPSILSTGEGLVPPDALPSEQVLSLMGIMPTDLPVVESEVEAVNASRALLGKGVDGIKLFVSSLRGASLSEGLVAAVVEEARRRGKPVFVHVNSDADVLLAARSGVDVIAHTTPMSGAWDETLLRTMRDRGVALIPTLQLWRYQRRHDRLSVREELVQTAVGQLRAWLDARGTVLFGTDLGAVEYDPTDEYTLMAEAGMSARQILASLTTSPAERFGASGRLGKVAPGFEADLVVLEGDPTRDIRAFAAVRYTVRAGRVVYRAKD